MGLTGIRVVYENLGYLFQGFKCRNGEMLALADAGSKSLNLGAAVLKKLRQFHRGDILDVRISGEKRNSVHNFEGAFVDGGVYTGAIGPEYSGDTNVPV